MQMPIVVGVIVALMFLITFSEWFYNLVSGWEGLIVNDIFINYRMIGAGVISVAVFVVTFWVVSLVNECSEEERVGLFAKLDCEQYLSVRTAAEELFQTSKETVNKFF